MSLTLEFHDSEIRDVVADGTGLRVRLAAASVRDADGRRGWMPSVQLVLADATATGDLRHAFGKITEGRLSHGGQALARLALPIALDGAVKLALRLANGTALDVRARALAASVDPGARFTEDLSC